MDGWMDGWMGGQCKQVVSEGEDPSDRQAGREGDGPDGGVGDDDDTRAFWVVLLDEAQALAQKDLGLGLRWVMWV